MKMNNNDIATIQDLKDGKEFYLLSQQTGLVVTCSPQGANHPILANLQEYDRYSFFRFVLKDLVNEIYLIQAIAHNSTVSARGYGWPLWSIVEDLDWAEFKFQQSIYDQVAINIQSAHPIANAPGNAPGKGSWVSVVGARRELRVYEIKPIKGWSEFIPFLAP